jgi:alkylglycerol monooxygenase
MHPVLYAIPFFYLAMAAESVAARILRRKVYDIADTITNLQLGLLTEISSLAMKVIYFDIYAFVYLHCTYFHTSSSNTVVWIAAFLTYDFIYYWVHRAQHRIGVFWAMHSVHHSSEHYNFSVNLRGSISPNFVHWLFYLPMAVAGVPPAIFFVVAVTNGLLRYWTHTELIGKLGWLDFIIITPANHGVHHGQNDYCLDKNFSGVFMIWDHIFGTYAAKRDAEPIIYGIRNSTRSYAPVTCNIHVYADLVQSARRTKGLGAKIRCWFLPPSALNSATHRPRDTRPAAQPATQTRPRWMWIALSGHAAVLCATITLLRLDGTIPGWEMWAGMIAIVLLAVGVGALLDNSAGPMRGEGLAQLANSGDGSADSTPPSTATA